MGLTKRTMEESDDGGFGTYVEDLVAYGYIDKTSAVAGILRQVVAQGEDSMTDAQRAVYDREFLRPYGRRTCRIDGDLIEWRDMLVALKSGWCGYHTSRGGAD